MISSLIIGLICLTIDLIFFIWLISKIKFLFSWFLLIYNIYRRIWIAIFKVGIRFIESSFGCILTCVFVSCISYESRKTFIFDKWSFFILSHFTSRHNVAFLFFFLISSTWKDFSFMIIRLSIIICMTFVLIIQIYLNFSILFYLCLNSTTLIFNMSFFIIMPKHSCLFFRFPIFIDFM